MREYKCNIFNKNILCILILSTLIYIGFAIIPKLTLKSYGATYTYTNSSNDLPSNFDSTYPGYKSLLKSLAKSHPNWTFKLYETGLDWDTVINSEYLGHGSSPKNLVPSSYSSEWVCSICGTTAYDNGSWYCASRTAIEYVMDPRNSITDTYIFQYLQLSNDSNITKSQVATMASGISYLNNDTIITAIYEVANEKNINPFYIIGKILQEQGSGASALCSGQGYNGQYVGYYNLLNVGASGNTTSEVILNGLAYAKNKGWDTPQKSLIGGLSTIQSYINRGQDTLYYQKFNVVYGTLYSGQYAQNLFDAQSIGLNLKKYYNNAGLLESNFTFEIPLYKNMSSSATLSPTLSNSTETGEYAYINATGGLALRSSPGGSKIAYVSEGTQVLITERATSKSSDGYYWDKVSTPQGTGYMARESLDGTKTYLVVIQQYEISGNYMIVSPGTSISAISGATNSSSYFGTGSNITLDSTSYTLIMLGDVSGDGKISATDYVKIRNRIMETNNLNELQLKAADVNRDGKISSTDYVKVRNQIMGTSTISL